MTHFWSICEHCLSQLIACLHLLLIGNWATKSNNYNLIITMVYYILKNSIIYKVSLNVPSLDLAYTVLNDWQIYPHIADKFSESLKNLPKLSELLPSHSVLFFIQYPTLPPLFHDNAIKHRFKAVKRLSFLFLKVLHRITS